MTTRLRKLAALLILPLLLWPALVNHYPLLFPDSLDYLAQGRPILHALFHAHAPLYIMRSAIYPLGIYAFHWNLTPWPIVLLHAAIASYTIYLTTRSITPRNATRNTVLLLAALSLTTSLSWYITLLMPDILGGPFYLALYLLTFTRTTLTKAEQLILAAIAIFAATSHPTHLVIAIAVLITSAIDIAARKPWRPSRTFAPFALNHLLPAVAILLAAVTLQAAINYRLNGHATMPRPPYLEARLLADGPGAQYLRDHCPDPKLPALCTHLNNLPPNDDQFLWDDAGIWSQANPAEQTELRHEETPLALATLRTYPRAQLAASFHNFAAQLTSFGLDDFDDNDFLHQHLHEVLPNTPYDHTLQAHNAIPWRIPTILQNLVVAFSVMYLVLIFITNRRHHTRTNSRLAALTTIVVAVIFANAALTGIFSEVDSRYQSRIIWLLPFLAALYLMQRTRGIRESEE